MDETPQKPPFDYPLTAYRCPACRRERVPGANTPASCERCGADLALSDAIRLQARELYFRGLQALPRHPAEAEELLRTSESYVPHPATRRALAVAWTRLDQPRETLAHLLAE